MQWKPIPNFPDYEISEYGDVRRLTSAATRKIGHVVKGSLEQGYKKVKLSVGGKKIVVPVHRLVCHAFVSTPPFEKAVCRHLNDDRSNNHYTNLSWGSHWDNHQDRKRNGKSFEGDRNGRSKLTWNVIFGMRKIYAETNMTVAELSRKFNVSYSQTSEIVKNQSWVK
jgi:hypothetical protein